MIRRDSTHYKIYNAVALEIGWAACVLGAAAETAWIGVLVVAGLVAIHLGFAENARKEATYLLLIGVLGWMIDSAQGLVGIMNFRSGDTMTAYSPFWLVALWINLGTALSGCLAWLAERPWIAAILGAIFGPLSYYSGTKFDALILTTSLPIALLTLAAAWAIALPAMYVIRRELYRRC